MSDPVVVEVAIDAPAERVWRAFREAAHQRGVVADAGTLVAREKTIVSAYGLDDDGFAALGRRLG
ncbi:hypothetical protein [Conexibacter sp. CPCC 206217]|uniref:hypothetical protein n=1 Tax=Conexibacter sp. CPCC 206217 TaxID=3064574 RepID=UPI00271C65CE|nr:hypothetical protein [Conexibacter sp. CPCC 206217]MDO8209100.1 hypothetical protein [Conexibacter sp. CPCC 206217]